MTRFRHALILAGVAFGASALLPPAHASADTIDKFAHALFDSSGDSVGMDVDVEKIAGNTTIDVQWHDVRCERIDTAYVCDYVWRSAFGVPVEHFSFSLTGTTTVAADLPYQELRRHCSTVDEQEECSTAPETSGTTRIEVTWTASGEPTRSEWTDEQGVRRVVKQVDTTVSGSAFDRTYGGAPSYGVVHRVRTVDAS